MHIHMCTYTNVSVCGVILLFNANPNNYNKFGKKKKNAPPKRIKCLLFFHKKPTKTEAAKKNRINQICK